MLEGFFFLVRRFLSLQRTKTTVFRKEGFRIQHKKMKRNEKQTANGNEAKMEMVKSRKMALDARHKSSSSSTSSERRSWNGRENAPERVGKKTDQQERWQTRHQGNVRGAPYHHHHHHHHRWSRQRKTSLEKRFGGAQTHVEIPDCRTSFLWGLDDDG